MIVSEKKDLKKLDDKDLENVNGGLIVNTLVYAEKLWIIDDKTGQCVGEEASFWGAEQEAEKLGLSKENVGYETYMKRYPGRTRLNRHLKSLDEPLRVDIKIKN